MGKSQHRTIKILGQIPQDQKNLRGLCINVVKNIILITENCVVFDGNFGYLVVLL